MPDATLMIVRDGNGERGLGSPEARAQDDRHGGRCPSCGATYPRRIPAGEDQRCWTCATADQTGLDEKAEG